MLSFCLSLSLSLSKNCFGYFFLSFLPKSWQLWVGGRMLQFLADFTCVLDIYIFYYLILYDNKQCQMFNNIYIYIYIFCHQKIIFYQKNVFFNYYFVKYATCIRFFFFFLLRMTCIRVGLRNFTKRAVTANTYCWICHTYCWICLKCVFVFLIFLPFLVLFSLCFKLVVILAFILCMYNMSVLALMKYYRLVSFKIFFFFFF